MGDDGTVAKVTFIMIVVFSSINLALSIVQITRKNGYGYDGILSMIEDNQIALSIKEMECEKYIQPSPYSNANRVIGYIAEMIMQLYFIHNQLKIKSVPYLAIENDGKECLKKSSFGEYVRMKTQEFLLKTLLKKKLYCFRKYKFTNPAFLVGLEKDGIEI